MFGEKDFQQLAVVRRLVRDLRFDVQIVGAPTVRERDGLALSSRNVRLDPAARRQARVLSRALDEAERAVAARRARAARGCSRSSAASSRGAARRDRLRRAARSAILSRPRRPRSQPPRCSRSPCASRRRRSRRGGRAPDRQPGSATAAAQEDPP